MLVKVEMALAGVVGVLVGLLGGFDHLLRGLLIMMGLDLTLLLLVALVEERANLRLALATVYQKIGVLVGVAVAVVLDSIIGGADDPAVVRVAVIGFFIAAVEGPSILTNLRRLGVQIPEDLPRALLRLGQRNAPPDEKPRG